MCDAYHNMIKRVVFYSYVYLLLTGPPIIITHPTNEVINATTSVTLNCNATGGGKITYRWESSIDGGPWMLFFEDSSKIPVRALAQAMIMKYRCIASNEAGRTVSNTSIVTVMGKPISLLTLI